MVPDDDFRAFAHDGGDRFWAVGNAGLVLHWDGERFAHWRVGHEQLTDVVTDGASTWVHGHGHVARYREGVWKRFELSSMAMHTYAVSTRDQQAWVVAWGKADPDAKKTKAGPLLIHVAADDTVTSHAMPVQADDVWARSATDVWVVGSLGYGIWRWDGRRWTNTKLPARPLDETDFGSRIAGTSADDVWAMTALKTWHWNGRRWAVVEGAPRGHRLQVRSRTEVLVEQQHAFSRWDGNTWHRTSGRGLLLDEGRVLVSTDQLAVHDRNGTPGTPLMRGAGIRARDLWVGPDEVLVAGKAPDADGGMIARWDGTAWTRELLKTPRVVDVDGVATPWLLHENGTVSHRVKGAWLVEATGLEEPAQLVAVSDAELWVASDKQLAHRTNGVWTLVPAPDPEGIRAIATAPTGAVFVVGRRSSTSATATLYRWDGRSFVAVAPFEAPERFAALGDKHLVAAWSSSAKEWRGEDAKDKVTSFSFLTAMQRTGSSVVLAALPDVSVLRDIRTDDGSVLWATTLPATGALVWEGLPIYATAIASRDGQVWMMSEGGDLAVRAR